MGLSTFSRSEYYSIFFLTKKYQNLMIIEIHIFINTHFFLSDLQFYHVTPFAALAEADSSPWT
jgi:hypothetical protein